MTDRAAAIQSTTADREAQQRIVSAKQRNEDQRVDGSLRPKSLAEYIGQDRVKTSLSVFIEAAKRPGELL